MITNKNSALQKEEQGKRISKLTIPDSEQHKKDEEYIGQLAAIVESSDDAIISKTFDGIIKSWNKGSEKMFGYNAAEAIGKHISLILPPEYNEEEKDILERIRKNEIIEHYETVRNRKNGERFYVSLTVSPLKDRAGNIMGVSTIARDITLQRKSEREQTNAHKELVYQNNEKEKRAAELIIANKELAFQNGEKEKRAAELIIANKELAFQNKEKEKRAGEVSIANIELVFQNDEKEKRAAELIIANKELVYQNDEKEKRAAELVVANKELMFQNDEKGKRAAELVIANRELAFLNKEKEKRAVELSIANIELVFQNDEKEKRAAELIIANKELVFQNEEKEKRAGQLESVNNELEAFSYSVSHDLRAPLRAINGYAKILEEDYSGKFDADGIVILHSIMHNSKKMGDLIDDLLAFSRLGRKEITISEINMNTLVKSVIEEVQATDIEKKTEFNVAILPTINGDIALIRQVWINLISNSVKYSKYKPKPSIEIAAYTKDNLVVYYVKDNGAGFDMQYYDKLFGVFQRLHSQDEFEGTGIGLAIVQKIVQRHNGAVWAESKLNEGTCFYFSLPDTNP